jgi:hypothetical protein
MRGYFSTTQLSEQEKENILSKHRELYNGYQTMQPKVSNTQPLYVYDPAQDKEGMIVNNKGQIKPNSNVGINESTEAKEVCDECGAMMMEGECSECGWKGEVGAMDEHWQDGDPQYSRLDEGECSECGGLMSEGECTECGWKNMEESNCQMDEETGHLDDIYHEMDLDPTAGFDYIEGPSNDVDTFKGMHKKLYEQGGNVDDMDVDDEWGAYNFDSDGPMAGGDVYPVNELDEDDDFSSLVNADDEIEAERDTIDEREYDTMESAFANEVDEQDISGVQGIYGDMEPAYDFDSDGPGKAGPYQHSQYNEDKYKSGYEGEDEDVYWDKDLDDDELNLDFEKFNPRDKSWEEITAHTGADEFEFLDEDIRESLVQQKNKINEMMIRMKVIK